MHPKKVIAIGMIWSGLIILSFALLKPFSAVAQTPPPPVVMPTIGILTPPPTVYPPTQADQGAQVYFYICLVCHGDQGQGLDAWRKELQPPDNNCWQSKCHAPNHIDESFTFPKQVPPLKDPGLLLKFGNAAALHAFIKGNMPWQQPGYLTDAEYWQLTAFLMRLNGDDPGQLVIGPDNAAKIAFTQPTQASPRNISTIWPYAFVIVLVAIILILAVIVYLRKRIY